MKIPKICNPQVHDLLEIEPDSLSPCLADAPLWAREALASFAWVVVRRAHAPAGQIGVGFAAPPATNVGVASARAMVCEGSLDLKGCSISSVHQLKSFH
jgi:hypothetical protein